MQSWLMAHDIMLMTVSTRYQSEVEFEQVRRLVAWRRRFDANW